jgi:hypothetical protein
METVRRRDQLSYAMRVERNIWRNRMLELAGHFAETCSPEAARQLRAEVYRLAHETAPEEVV